jgi:hypothetical protein
MDGLNAKTRNEHAGGFEEEENVQYSPDSNRESISYILKKCSIINTQCSIFICTTGAFWIAWVHEVSMRRS